MLRNLYLFTVFFPYVSPILINGDIQPLNFIMALVYFFLTYSNKLEPIKFIFLFFAVLISFIGLIDLVSGSDSFSVLRGCAAYFAFILNFLNLKYIYFNHYAQIRNWILWALIIYVVVGISQIFFGHWTDFFVNQPSYVTSGRGVSSLAAEPTFFGFIILLLILSSRRMLEILIAILGLILSRSASAIMSIAIIYGLNFRKSLNILILIAAGFIFSIYFFDELITWRPIILLRKAIDNGFWFLLMSDHSINDRLGSLVLSVQGSFSNFFIPHGFAAWPTFVDTLRSDLIYYFPFVSTGHGRIHSSLGAIFFELGFIGILMLFLIIYTIKGRFYKFAFVIIISQAVPWSLPYVALYVASNSKPGKYLKEEKNRNLGLN